MALKILCVSPGPDWSVSDVARGHMAGLRELGHEVRHFDLSTRLKFYDQALRHFYLRSGKMQPPETVARLASEKVVVEAVRFQPDVVHFVSGMAVHPIAYSDLRRAGFRISLYLTECPYDDGGAEPALEFVDWLFVNERLSVDHFRGRTPQEQMAAYNASNVRYLPAQPRPRHVHYLPHAFDPQVHRPVQVGPEYWSDVFFVGTGFPERIALLEAVDWTGIDLKIRGFWELRPDSPLQPFYRGGVLDNAEAVKWYAGAKVCLNLYRTSRGYGSGEHVHAAWSLNPRAYELAACSAFQLSEWRPEVDELFGDSVATFRGPAELRQQLDRWLPDEERDLRQAMGESAHAIVALDHDFEARMAQMLAIIEEDLP